MIAQCANRHCTARLQFLHEGRLFVTYPSDPSLTSESVIEYVWLCGACCQQMTVDSTGKVVALESLAGEDKRAPSGPQ
jgi:hypothetical protein